MALGCSYMNWQSFLAQPRGAGPLRHLRLVHEVEQHRVSRRCPRGLAKLLRAMRILVHELPDAVRETVLAESASTPRRPIHGARVPQRGEPGVHHAPRRLAARERVMRPVQSLPSGSPTPSPRNRSGRHRRSTDSPPYVPCRVLSPRVSSAMSVLQARYMLKGRTLTVRTRSLRRKVSASSPSQDSMGGTFLASPGTQGSARGARVRRSAPHRAVTVPRAPGRCGAVARCPSASARPSFPAG